ncbi:hypothetical protein Tco_1197837 [Tanacetum coccineum]
MFNPFVQELPASEQLVSVNDTYVDFLSDSNVISDNPYTGTNEDEVVQEMTSLAQNDVAILSLTDNMQHEVTRCNTVDLESKQVNETLTIKLERYKEKVKFLESEKENQLVFTSTEKGFRFSNKKTNLIMEYLVNISKRRTFLSLNEDILKINDSDN